MINLTLPGDMSHSCHILLLNFCINTSYIFAFFSNRFYFLSEKSLIFKIFSTVIAAFLSRIRPLNKSWWLIMRYAGNCAFNSTQFRGEFKKSEGTLNST